MGTRRFRHRVAALLALALVSALTRGIGSTTATFAAATRNDAPGFTLDALLPPAGFDAVVVGNRVDLAWTPGAFEGSGDPAGHRVDAVSLGVEADPRDGDPPAATCDGSSAFDTLIGRVGTGSTTVSDATAGADAGSWLCYRVRSEFPATPATAGWSSLGEETIAVQLGHVIRTVTLVDGGTPGELRPGDAFVLTFNQPVDSSTGPVSTSGGTIPTAGNDICAIVNGSAIVIARNESLLNTNCAASNGHRTGKLATVAMSPGGQRNSYHATYTWSDCEVDDPGACRTMTATLGDRYKGTTDITVDATGAAITPNVAAGALLAVDGTPLCSTANNGRHTCRPVVVGSL